MLETELAATMGLVKLNSISARPQYVDQLPHPRQPQTSSNIVMSVPGSNEYPYRNLR